MTTLSDDIQNSKFWTGWKKRSIRRFPIQIFSSSQSEGEKFYWKYATGRGGGWKLIVDPKRVTFDASSSLYPELATFPETNFGAILVPLLFFAAYLKVQGKLFMQYSGVVFFYHCIFVNYFYFQLNGIGSAVRTKISQALGPGLSLCRAINFHNFIDICQNFHLFSWHCG